MLRKIIVQVVFGVFIFIILISLASWERKVRSRPLKPVVSSTKETEQTRKTFTEPYTNRLIHEKSPYLLQHAHNPVDWYSWGEEAIQKAKKEDKPIFLSVGYSTCHWCHVMEDESFSNPAIAKIMNENFVSIKVDREERPDVDNIYMQAVMAMTGSGGWPMTVFLTPELKPFYGGTYFPPNDKWGRPGLVTILRSMSEQWKSNRSQIFQSSEQMTQGIQAAAESHAAASENLDANTLKLAYEQLRSNYDSTYGGFGGAPKFPRSHLLSFLLRYWKRSGDMEALKMVEKTLQETAKGGLYDHVGGGFHRYSTDSRWHVPHFEKMLYDQAILANTYLEAYQITKKEEYARVTREIFEYVLRDMSGSGGAFYSAEDADSAPDPSQPNQKSEGAFYIWSKDEIEKALGPERAGIFNYIYDVKPDGNVGHDPQIEFGNKSILHVVHSVDEAATKFQKTPDQIKTTLDDSKKILFGIRSKRLRPHLDDKVLTDWNGLMISSLAFGSRVLNEPRYMEAAKKAADFLLEKMKRKDGRLMHRYRDGEVVIPGFIEDYAFFTHGLFDLYEVTFNPHYLEEAQFFAKEMVRLFWDEKNGGFYFRGSDSENLIAQTKELYDGAIPSGNSVATLSLLRIGRLTLDQRLEEKANENLNAFSTQIARSPSAFPQMLMALDFAIGPSQEIVIAGDSTDGNTKLMIQEVFNRFLPNKVVAFHPNSSEEKDRIEKLSPFVKSEETVNGLATAYVCKNYVCNFPTTELLKFKELLDNQK